MSNVRKNDDMDSLFEAIMSLENLDECYAFFDDLLTVPEMNTFAQRYKVAGMLLDGKVYSEIVEQTGASTATISRVNRSLIYGCDGYKMVFSKLEAKEEDNND